MKIKCNDGKVRRFEVAACDGEVLPDGSRMRGYREARCLECGMEFGVHDTKILKPLFKKHVCKKQSREVIPMWKQGN